MKYDVPVEIIESAAECTRQSACLKNNGHRCCPVIETIGSEVLFIDPDANLYCDYRLSFAGGWICTCPVRKHLHQRYGD